MYSLELLSGGWIHVSSPAVRCLWDVSGGVSQYLLPHASIFSILIIEVSEIDDLLISNTSCLYVSWSFIKVGTRRTPVTFTGLAITSACFYKLYLSLPSSLLHENALNDLLLFTWRTSEKEARTKLVLSVSYNMLHDSVLFQEGKRLLWIPVTIVTLEARIARMFLNNRSPYRVWDLRTEWIDMKNVLFVTKSMHKKMLSMRLKATNYAHSSLQERLSENCAVHKFLTLEFLTVLFWRYKDEK